MEDGLSGLIFLKDSRSQQVGLAVIFHRIRRSPSEVRPWSCADQPRGHSHVGDGARPSSPAWDEMRSECKA